MAIGILDQIGALISSIGLDPATTVILASFFLAILPAIKRGVLDNRLEDILESLDYGLVILATGFLLAFYYQFGLGGVQDELLSITGGFVLGTVVVRFITKLTTIK